MVTSGYQFMNWQFVHLSKNMPTEHQLLVTVLAYRKYRRSGSSISLGLAKETISLLWKFCNHPQKGWSNEPKTICFTMYLHFGHTYSEMGKENKLAFRNYIIYLHLCKKIKPQKVME